MASAGWLRVRHSLAAGHQQSPRPGPRGIHQRWPGRRRLARSSAFSDGNRRIEATDGAGRGEGPRPQLEG